MGLHRQFGLALVGLLVFRMYWGIAGTTTARFASFVRGPRAIGAYLTTLRRPYAPSFGHSPLGALSVVALLGLLCAQVATGLFAVDVDGIESGHLSHLVSFDQGRQLAEIHEASFDILIALIGLHLVAIALYYVALGANLIKPMVTGKRKASEKDPADAAGAVQVFPFMRIAIGLVIAGGVVVFIGQ
jgi:cytochrome b